MPVLPTPVVSSIGIRKVSLRNFRFPNYQAFCNHCAWESYEYITEDEAADRGDSHAERCCARINEGLALKVSVAPTQAQDLELGQHILLKDLRTMVVENIDLFDDEVMLTYSIDGLESQIMMLSVGHVVKVVSE